MIKQEWDATKVLEVDNKLFMKVPKHIAVISPLDIGLQLNSFYANKISQSLLVGKWTISNLETFLTYFVEKLNESFDLIGELPIDELIGNH